MRVAPVAPGVEWVPAETSVELWGELWRLPGGLDSPAAANGPRDLFVWLPPGRSSVDPLSVLYLQDGQNLFDPDTAWAGAWRVDEAMRSIDGSISPTAVVGIPNAGDERIWEYAPWPDRRHGGGGGVAYVELLLAFVLPKVEARFPVRTDAAGRGIGGSSLGALISLYAAFARPGIFDRVLALSPSVGFAGGAIRGPIRRASRPPSRIYVDVGTEEIPDAGLFDRWFRRRSSWWYVRRVRALARSLQRGGRSGSDVRLVVEPGGRHGEEAWGRRLPEALRFLFA